MDTNAFDGVSFIWRTSVAKLRPWHLLDSGTLPCTFYPTRIAWPRALLLMDLRSCPNMSNLFVSGGALPSHRLLCPWEACGPDHRSGVFRSIFPKPHLDYLRSCLGTFQLEHSGQAPRRPHASVILALSH